MMNLKSENSKKVSIELTKREEEILNLVLEGNTSRKVAERLCISPRTVDVHRRNLLMKFRVNNTASLIRAVFSN